MNEFKKTINKPGHDFNIGTINDTTGYDLASFILNDNVTYHGFFKFSPLKERLEASFNELKSIDESLKPYKACWMIDDSRLLLGFVNGVFNDKMFYTTDLIKEFPDNELLFHYSDFDGPAKLVVQTIEVEDSKKEHINCDFIILRFRKGIAVEIDFENF